MSPDILFGIAIAIAVIVALARAMAPKPMPPKMVFECRRCGTATRHGDRTIRAWRLGKKDFFCGACHAKWLETLPAAERSRADAQGKAGCLGAIAALGLLPAAAWLAWL